MLQPYKVFFPTLWRLDIVKLDEDIKSTSLEDQLEQYLSLLKSLQSLEPLKASAIWIVPDDAIVLPDGNPDMDDIWNRIQSPGFLQPLKRRQTLKEVIKSPVNDYILHLVIKVFFATQAVNICRLDTGQISIEDLPHNTLIKTLCPNGVPIEQATFYKSSAPVFYDEEPFAPPEVTTLNKFTLRELNKYLHEIYPWGLNPGHIHVFIDIPREVPDLPEFEARLRHLDYIRSASSSEGQPEVFAKIQQDSALAIECGRPRERESRIPASLFNEALCKLQHDLQFGEPTPADKVGFRELRQALVGFFQYEDSRKKELRRVMQEALGHKGLLWSARDVRDGTALRYESYSNLQARIGERHERFMIIIQEVKGELTGNQTDPFLQAIRSYRAQLSKYWKEDKSILTNYPAILVLHFGPYVAIAVAVFTDKIRVEHLSCISLHAHSTNVYERQAGERAVYALRVAVEGLEQFYKNLQPPEVPIQPVQNFFPFRNYYTVDKDDTRHEFIYKKAEEDKRVFRAELKDAEKTQIYVKFTRRYSEAAHRAAYEAGYAPELLAVNDVYGWYMVVMRDISSEYRILWGLEGEMASKAKARAKEAMKAMHKKGFVHGDARSVNIMVHRDDSEDIKLIDWDWAGRIGEATYPHNLNDVEIRWPDGVKSFAEIKPQHDLDAIETL